MLRIVLVLIGAAFLYIIIANVHWLWVTRKH